MVSDAHVTYDAAGNVATLATSLAPIPGVAGTGGTETQAFCYDEQDRLVWASTQSTGSCGTAGSESLTGAGYTASYAYDTLGRISSASVLDSGNNPLAGAAQGSYTYGDLAHAHAVTGVGSGATGYGATYDAAGNLLCRALGTTTCTGSSPTGQPLGYDALGWLTSWQNATTNPTASETYAYDGAGARVWRQNVTASGVTTTTVSILGVEDLVSTSASGQTTTDATCFYSLPGGLQATRDSSELTYLGRDLLGTPNAALSPTSGVVGEQLRTPYGQARYGAAAVTGGGAAHAVRLHRPARGYHPGGQ